MLHLKVPAGVQNGDLLLASITFDSGAAPMPPNGWALVPNATATSSSNAQTSVWYHIANHEPDGYTWHWGTTADPAGGMTATPVSRRVNNPRFDDPACVEPQSPGPGSLFS